MSQRPASPKKQRKFGEELAPGLWLKNANVLDRANFEGEFFDLAITSPPYNVGIEYASNDDEGEYGAGLFKKMAGKLPLLGQG